jgi:hypothetical protein
VAAPASSSMRAHRRTPIQVRPSMRRKFAC